MRKFERELLQEYDEIRTAMQNLLTHAAEEGRALYEDDADGRTNERAVFDELEAKGLTLKERIKQERRLRAVELELLPGELPDDHGAPPAAAAGQPGERSEGELESRESSERDRQRKEAFCRYIANGSDAAYRQACAQLEIRQRDSSGVHESRSMQAENDVAGGFITAPAQWSNEIIQAMNASVVMRRISKVVPLQANAGSLGYPKVDTKLSGAVHGSEIGSIPEMSGPVFGAREWKPAPITGYSLLSRTLLRRAVVSADEYLSDEIRRVFSEQEEEDYCTGDGAAGVSLGVFTASDQGISTSRDFGASINATDSIKLNGLKACKHGIKRGYWPFLRWVLHPDAVANVDYLQDNNGRPVWDENIKDPEGNPRLLGFPVEISDYAPNTFTTGQYVGILGAFNPYYLIAVEQAIEIMRLNELRALNDQIVLLGRTWVDGMPKLEEAFARIKLG